MKHRFLIKGKEGHFCVYEFEHDNTKYLYYTLLEHAKKNTYGFDYNNACDMIKILSSQFKLFGVSDCVIEIENLNGGKNAAK